MTNSSRNKTIDVMRGFAVLLVIAYHAFPDVVKSGFVGVDVFFVVSGFVIFKSIKDREIGSSLFPVGKGGLMGGG